MRLKGFWKLAQLDYFALELLCGDSYSFPINSEVIQSTPLFRGCILNCNDTHIPHICLKSSDAGRLIVNDARMVANIRHCEGAGTIAISHKNESEK